MSDVINRMNKSAVDKMSAILSGYGFKYVGKATWKYGDVVLHTIAADKSEMKKRKMSGWFSLVPEGKVMLADNTTLSVRWNRAGQYMLWWDLAAMLFGGPITTWPGNWSSKSDNIIHGSVQEALCKR